MTTTGRKLMGVGLGVAIAGVLIGLYIANYLVGNTPAFRATPVSASQREVSLTIQTVAAVGPQLAPNHPDWVSYLVRRQNGTWERSTVYTVPANALVHVTIYNFDGASGLRNPFLGEPQGLVGKEVVDGKPLTVMPPDQPSHTFAIPQLGVLVPVAPVGDDAKNQCGYAPCSLSMAHRTITFTFRTGKKGHYRWQCFVPCAAGFEYGFGGAMQTVGYMDGYINVV
ncbi:MAG TPA: hypothetical protein VHC01_14355 [Gaiellaceae bacterium]|nr:hypothetical protein [Gaiellaceae bacterium]